MFMLACSQNRSDRIRATVPFACYQEASKSPKDLKTSTPPQIWTNHSAGNGTDATKLLTLRRTKASLSHDRNRHIQLKNSSVDQTSATYNRLGGPASSEVGYRQYISQESLH